jgi:hypothetical protein
MRIKLAIAAVLAAVASLALAEEGRFDKTIAFPRGGEVKLDWSYQKCTIENLRVLDYPSAFDIEKARRENPNDHTTIHWEFRIDNRSSNKYDVKLSVEILDSGGQVVKAGERSPTVSAHSAETAKISTRVRTVEAADSPRVRIRADIVPR